MSEICPHCGIGFKRLASHEWRCKEKKTSSSFKSGSSFSSRTPSSSVVGSSGTGRHNTPPAGNSSGTGQHNTPSAGNSSGTGRHNTPSAGNSSGAGRHSIPSAGNITGAWRPTTPSAGKSSGTRGHPKPSDTLGKSTAGRSSVSDSGRRHSDPKPAEIVVKICPDCGANYRHKHEVCHSRGSGKREDKAAYDVKEVCPDCGRSYKYSHTVCRGRQKSDPVRHHRLMIPNRPSDPTNQQSTRHNYTSRLGHLMRNGCYVYSQGKEAYGYKDYLDESEGLAAAFETSVNVKETHARRPRRNNACYNGGLSDGDALAAAFKASLNLKEEDP
ncbi:replication initiator 1-like isoform X2 [Haliotis rubra]|nr:replication initiator 1-like isoform X2 [Haliotis rubra]